MFVNLLVWLGVWGGMFLCVHLFAKEPEARKLIKIAVIVFAALSLLGTFGVFGK